MPKNKFTILSTRPLDETSIEALNDAGIALDTISFIETTPIDTPEINNAIQVARTQKATVVFTSMNAVEAVAAEHSALIPSWDIYCLGHTTKQLASTYFGEASIKGTAPHATALADRMIEDAVQPPLIFFCGDQRRDELPDRLHAEGLTLQEIVVYRTMPVHRAIDKPYNGVLFFSPSAVESFFHSNYLSSDTLVFAIGQTTATTIRKYTDQTIIISDHPAKEQLVQKVITYFSALS